MTAPTTNESDSLKSQLAFERTRIDRTARRLTAELGSVRFLVATAVLIIGWVLLNVGVFGNEPFDEYPFVLLGIIISTVAMVVSIIVLISQNREAHIAETRQKIDLEINVRTEHEVTKILSMIDTLHREIGISRRDQELEDMKQTTDITEIKEKIEEDGL